MPTYVYECIDCQLKFEVSRKVEDRDDLASVTAEYCPKAIDEAERQFLKYNETGIKPIAKPIIHDCKLKRCITSGSFKI